MTNFEKISFSIVGTCASREIFNTELLREYSTVGEYAFQRCLWDTRPKSNDVPLHELDRINTENFTARMLYYTFNSKVFDELQKKKSDYLVIDIYNIQSFVSKVVLGGETYYFQNTAANELDALKKARLLPYFAEMQLETPYEVAEELIEEGLKYFAEKITGIYPADRIIINIPKHAHTYYRDKQRKNYSEEYVKSLSERDEKVERWSIFLSSLMPGVKILRDEGEPVAAYALCDRIGSPNDAPPAIHHSKVDLLKKGYRMLKLIGIEPQRSLGEYLEAEILYAMDSVTNINSELRALKEKQLTLNNYFSKIKDKNRFIIVLSVRDEASNNLRYFRNKQQLPLNFHIGFRDAYIAVVDMKRDFVYEKPSTQKLEYSYTVGGKTINITSAGWLSGNISKVTLDGETNLSKNLRGININVFDSETLEPVDRATCDSFIDRELKVTSDYFMRAQSEMVLPEKNIRKTKINIFQKLLTKGI